MKIHKFHTFQDALDKVEQFSTDLGCDVTITLEEDGTFAFFGNGKTIATWISGDTVSVVPRVLIKGYLKKEKV